MKQNLKPYVYKQSETVYTVSYTHLDVYKRQEETYIKEKGGEWIKGKTVQEGKQANQALARCV